MSIRGVLCTAILVTCGSVASSQQRLDHPDQFYTNGDKLNGWTRDEANGLRSTLWFAKNPADSLSYRQQIVIVYDSEPDKAYYFDSRTRRFVGRFDMQSGKYSMLPVEARRERREEIPETSFPSPGDMPAIGDMFDDPAGNRQRMTPAPPTRSFPRLQTSTWDTNYIAADRRRVRARVDFNGNHGTYTLMDSNVVGRLSNVEYFRVGEEFRISGRWNLASSTGHFTFTIPPAELDVFWGEWGFEPNEHRGTWDGVRRPH